MQDRPGRWIFGYGSLIWRPSIPFVERRTATIAGWVRRFWQGSIDHRGVPGSPGRVVTLHEDPAERCWGRAYRIDREQEEEVLTRLDVREKGGYERREVTLHFQDRQGGVAPGLVYIATPRNRNYLGPAPLAEIADQVQLATGPSGNNAEYVLRLARALREMSAEDAHVFELAKMIGEPSGSPV
jgi:cation transport protein ChaC